MAAPMTLLSQVFRRIVPQTVTRCLCRYPISSQLARVSAFYSTAANEANLPDTLYKTLLVEVRGHDQAVLNSYEYFVNEAAKHLDIHVESSITPTKVIERRTMVKSVHNYGKYHKTQYEARTYFKQIELKRLTGSTADTYLEYIQRNLPEGVAMKVTKTRLEKIPEHITPPTADSKEL